MRAGLIVRAWRAIEVGRWPLKLTVRVQLMSASARPLEDIPVAELLRAGVWEYVPETDDHDETWVVPTKIPVSSLDGRVAALNVCLACGTTIPALLSNIDLRSNTLNEHLRSVSLMKADSDRFHLARYHDFDYGRRGPQALAEYLKLSLADVFPLTYDLSGLAIGDAACLMGRIPVEPAERFTRAEIIAKVVAAL